MNSVNGKDNKNSNIVNIMSLQHPVVLIWFISTLLFIFSGYICSTLLLS